MAGLLALLYLVIQVLVVALRPASSTAAPECFPADRLALLSFASLILAPNASSIYEILTPAAPLKDLWRGDRDCCTWVGVNCSNLTTTTSTSRRVSGIDLSFLSSGSQQQQLVSAPNILAPLCNLSLLSTLSLEAASVSFSTLHPIPACLGGLSELRSLYLSSLNLVGPIPSSFSRLLNLQDLTLTENTYLSGPLLPLSRLPTLTSLDLSACSFSGPLPPFHTPLLQYLILDLNSFNSTLHNFTLLSSLPSLFYLGLADNHFSGSIPPSISRFSNLLTLNLQSNLLTGALPGTLCELSHLFDVDLSSNTLVSGNASLDAIFNKCTFTNLHSLDLSGNNFTGPLPNWINGQTTPSLEVLSLGGNHFEGQLPEAWRDLQQLFLLRLSGTTLLPISHSTYLTRLPDWLFRLPISMLYLGSTGLHAEDVHCRDGLSMLNQTLQYLDLSNNNLTGPDTLQCLALHNFTLLTFLNLSSNPLNVNLSNFVLPLPTIVGLTGNLDLSYCSLGGYLTNDILPAMDSISFIIITLANNRLTGNVPSKLCSTSWSVDLTYNHFTGVDPCVNGTFLDLSSSVSLSHNALAGDFSSLLASVGFEHKTCNLWSSLQSLDLSYNNLTGEIPSSLGICARNAVQIVLGNNHLVGKIPHELASLTDLVILDLSNNQLQGTIPPFGTNLKSLKLNNNHLKGNIPTSITGNNSLQLLAASFNELDGDLNTGLFSANSTSLRVLLLGHNHIRGSMPALFGASMPALQLLDLSYNNLTGAIPQELHLLSFQTVSDLLTPSSTGTLFEEVVLVVKGVALQYEYVLKVMTSLDLSTNHLEGAVPPGLGDLSALLFLNLSHNRLSGSIPATLAKLGSLEALDLSSNKLEGSIPEDLSSLTKLESFNVSFNEGLKGAIPSGTQFESSESYRGDLQLCRYPTLEACKTEIATDAPLLKPQGTRTKGRIARWIQKWIYVPGLSLGFVLGFGSTLLVSHYVM